MVALRRVNCKFYDLDSGKCNRSIMHKQINLGFKKIIYRQICMVSDLGVENCNLRVPHTKPEWPPPPPSKRYVTGG